MTTIVMMHFDSDEGLDDGMAVLNVVSGLKAVKLTREEIARVIYEQDPWEDCGENIDGFQVVPGGTLSWEQAKKYEAEFVVDMPRCEQAYKCADALIARLK